jgi:hypothetical protein
LPVGFGQTRPATRLPVLVMVTGYARWLAARLLPSRVAEDLFAGWWQLIAQLGAVPRVLVWDGEGAVGQRRRRQTVLTEQAHAFRGVLGARILTLGIAQEVEPPTKVAGPLARSRSPTRRPSSGHVGGSEHTARPHQDNKLRSWRRARRPRSCVHWMIRVPLGVTAATLSPQPWRACAC